MTYNLENKDGKFIMHQLPIEAQLSSINQILIEDYIIAGNLYVSEIETPRNDGGFGYYFEGNGKGMFKPVPSVKSGLYTSGDVKDLVKINIQAKEYIISVKNNDYLQFISINK